MRSGMLEVTRRVARAAEGAPLLREYRVKSLIEGSNPSLSANMQKSPVYGAFLWVMSFRRVQVSSAYQWRIDHARRLATSNKKASGVSQRLRFFRIDAPGQIRTPDRLVRSQVLYPTELRAPKKRNFARTTLSRQ